MTLVFRHSVRSHRIALLVMTLAVVGFGILISTSFQGLGESFPLENLPAGIRAMLSSQGNLLAVSNAQGYIALGFRHPLVIVIIAAYGVASASAAIAGEIDRKTILMLLARPLPRHHLVIAKLVDSLLGIVALVLALFVGTEIGIALAGLGDAVSIGTLLLMSFNALALFFAIMGYSYLISALSSSLGRAIMLSTAVAVVSFFVDFMANLFDVLEPLGYISIFHYFDPIAIVAEGGFPSLEIGILLSVALVTTVAAIFAFQRRDIAV